MHLTGDGALPYKLVEPGLIVVEKAGHVLRTPRQVGGTDGFVCFLGVFRLGGIVARFFRQVRRAIIAGDDVTRAGNAFGRDLNAVGTHIGDETGGTAADIDAFVKPLGDLHCALSGKAEFSRGLLLQCRCGEGRLRVAALRFCIDGADRKGRSFKKCL